LNTIDKLPVWSLRNREFHTRLFASSRQRHVCDITNSLRDKIERYVRVEVAMTGNLDWAQAEHHLIFEAFAVGNAERAGVLSREHCAHTAERLITALRARETSDGTSQSHRDDSGFATRRALPRRAMDGIESQ
jgi:DNA-binding GntR family transcriptional regulator